MSKEVGLLLKIARPTAEPFAAVDGAGLRLEPLFEVPVPDGPGLTGRSLGWYAAVVDRESDHPWDDAHAKVTGAMGFGLGANVVTAEPDLEQSWITEPTSSGSSPFAAGGVCAFERAEERLGPAPGRPHWHLSDEFGGLKSARDKAMNGDGVVIAHLDTGYDPKHRILPENLAKDLQRNFVDGKDLLADATDRSPTSGLLKNRGHGTATLAILAGNKLQGFQGNVDTGDYLGGAPKAKIVPVRVGNSVVQFRTSSVLAGFNYARQIGADVLSMSMGGLASSAWADAVNLAYEAGLVMVCAAGNNFSGLPTRFIVHPARFQRVIAACGAMADFSPYFNRPMGIMQGNYGPSRKMKTALAAFTPNITWASLGCEDIVNLNGQGTSSATPQIAAAAALWLQKYKKQIANRSGWQKVETVRKALFDSANRDIRHMSQGDLREMFGNGVLRAARAVDLAPTKEDGLEQMPRDTASFAFLRVITGLGVAGDHPRAAMFRLEMTQLTQRSHALEAAIPDPDTDPELISDRERRRFIETILDEGKCSRALREYLEQRFSRRPQPPPVERRRAANAGPSATRRAPRMQPKNRRLRIFAIDPSFSRRLDTAFINQTTVNVPWEDHLEPGPVGEYLEVVDVDPASGAAYAPLDLDDPALLAEDGLAVSEGNPQFHQQMVYAVAMTTIRHFERALGRRALWSPRRVKDGKNEIAELYVPRLRVYPHALRQANAYYSPDRKALLFGYFPAGPSAGGAPGSMVFTCLSQDVIAHETTHALLDGIHRRFQEPSNPDVFSFHEGFADIVAIFQHFTNPTLLGYELRRTRGDLSTGHLLAELARELGEGIGRSAALRSAIAAEGKKRTLADATEAHDRGAILVAAVFDAFLAIYRRRTADLVRLATGGTGALVAGEIHPDLVDRLAEEAAKTAGHVLTICVRALDYLPPVDVTFGEYLRALITADDDLVPSDDYGYRVAFLEAFRARGIHSDGVRTHSVESLRWKEPMIQPAGLAEVVAGLDLSWDLGADRDRAYQAMRMNGATLHHWIASRLDADLADQLGLDEANPKVEVHSVRPARRVSEDGSFLTDLIVVLTQRAWDEPGEFWFRGGSTLIIDTRKSRERVRYVVTKRMKSSSRREAERKYRREGGSLSLRSMYFGASSVREPFAFAHRNY
jgi:hypothetical protein